MVRKEDVKKTFQGIALAGVILLVIISGMSYYSSQVTDPMVFGDQAWTFGQTFAFFLGVSFIVGAIGLIALAAYRRIKDKGGLL